MKIQIVLHSTTGNTRLVTRYAAGWLAAAGHDCAIHDIVRHPEPPAMDDVDLLVVAGPTMYFRPTLAMERFVARLPNVPAEQRKPAVLLGTCMGEPGAHFALQAEQLAYKGWAVLGAHWVLCPSNYPTHLAGMRPIHFSAGLEPLLSRMSRLLRPLWWTIWPLAGGEPDHVDRDKLDRFLERMLRKVAAGALHDTPAPNHLYRGIPTCNSMGRLFPYHLVDDMVKITIASERCSRCGNCVRVCPVGIVTRDHDEQVPRVGRGCSGCFACYNHCSDDAISAIATPAGKGTYHGPSPTMRALFKRPDR
jgi:NAD-dependent dihydropyrimidine dehydrogenase PreA subunit